MPTVINRNFSRSQVDCADYSGDLVLEHCNITQDIPDTGQGTIFINTGALTSLTIRDSNCVNHRQPPQGGVVYENCNIAQVDFTAIKRLGKRLKIDTVIEEQLFIWWRETRDYLIANPTVTFADYKLWFIANQGHTVFFADTFVTAIAERIDATFASGPSWSEIVSWIINNSDAEDFERAVL